MATRLIGCVAAHQRLCGAEGGLEEGCAQHLDPALAHFGATFD